MTRGYRSRSAATSCAAASEPPPSAKKSASRPVRGRAEQVLPQPGQPPRRTAELGRCLGIGTTRRWPGQRVTVDLARRTGGQLVNQDKAWHQRGGKAFAELGARGGDVEFRVGAGDVADQHRRAGCRPADRRRAATDSRKVDQRGVDLAQLDATAPDLDLIVGAAAEDQALAFQPHQIAAAVGAPPAQRRHRRVLLGVFGLVEVSGQAHATDHQLAHFTVVHRLALAVDDGQVPARQRQTDAHRADAVEPGRARDYGGLGGAVGVPHLAAFHGEAGGQLRGTGLAAEDQQPHRLERLGGPERGQGRHGRHHRDVAADQPRTEVHAAADQRPRRRDQAGAVPPGQPHLLA